MSRKTGIETRHAQSCAVRTGGRCRCTPSFQASVWDRRDKTRVRQTFSTFAAASAWRTDTISALSKGKAAKRTRQSLADAADNFLTGAEAGEILNRSRQPYKPSVLRGYRADLERYVLPELGAYRLAELRRRDFQGLVDRLRASGLSGSKVRNVLIPVQVIYRRAIRREDVGENPALDLELPEPGKRRDRGATAGEASTLIAALPEADRALWATAAYAGLRRGELRALRCEHVDLERNVILVEKSWDDVAGEIEPKSEKGVRTVPIANVLRLLLLEHLARTGRRDRDFVFGSKAGHPFTPTAVRKRALEAWAAVDPPLRPIGLHEARHTYVSLMHDAGLSLERIGDYVGHSSAYMTDAYRHLLEGHEAETAAQFDAYLERVDPLSARQSRDSRTPIRAVSGGLERQSD